MYVTKSEVLQKRFGDILKRFQRTHEKNLVDVDEVDAYCMEFIDAGCDSQQVVSFMSPEALFRKRYILKKRHVDFDMCCVMRDLPTAFIEEQCRAFIDWGFSISAVACFMSSDYIEDHANELEEMGLSFRDFIQVLVSKDEKYWLTWNKEFLRDKAPSMEDLEFLNTILERAA